MEEGCHYLLWRAPVGGTLRMCVQVIRKEFSPVIPSLIIVPNSSMSYWKGELEYWLGDSAEVIFYTGPPGARQQIAASEFWLLPGALDGKVNDPKEQLQERAPKPHIVLISMESMLQVRVSSKADTCPVASATHVYGSEGSQTMLNMMGC